MDPGGHQKSVITFGKDAQPKRELKKHKAVVVKPAFNYGSIPIRRVEPGSFTGIGSDQIAPNQYKIKVAKKIRKSSSQFSMSK